MPVEAIKIIGETESAAAALKAEASARAKRMIAEAEEAGKASVEAARERARQELASLRVQAADKARADAEALMRKTENRKAGMEARADKRMDAAVKSVVERIVNG